MQSSKDGAERRNRTTDTRIFSPLLYRLSYLGKKWSRQSDLNQRPTDYKSVALPTELCRLDIFKSKNSKQFNPFCLAKITKKLS